MTSMASTHSPDHSTRLSGAIIGILVFLAGIALVGYVFMKAHTLFDAPPQTIPATAFATPAPTPTPSAAGTALVTATTASPAVNPAVIAIGQNLSQFIEQLLLLLLMCIVGSVVASLGINLFFKALAAPRHAVVTTAASAPGGNTP